jgi:hypothetical protein
MGGGVFELTFPLKTDIFHGIDFDDASVDSVYGARNQLISAVWQGSPEKVPEPATLVLLATVAGIMLLRRNLNRKEKNSA